MSDGLEFFGGLAEGVSSGLDRFVAEKLRRRVAKEGEAADIRAGERGEERGKRLAEFSAGLQEKGQIAAEARAEPRQLAGEEREFARRQKEQAQGFEFSKQLAQLKNPRDRMEAELRMAQLKMDVIKEANAVTMDAMSKWPAMPADDLISRIDSFRSSQIKETATRLGIEMGEWLSRVASPEQRFQEKLNNALSLADPKQAGRVIREEILEGEGVSELQKAQAAEQFAAKFGMPLRAGIFGGKRPSRPILASQAGFRTVPVPATPGIQR